MIRLPRIELQKRTRARSASVAWYWFENATIGLPRTRFHRITIALEPFDSGLACVDQPEKTQVVVDWLALALRRPGGVAGLRVSASTHPQMEASVYVGGAHNRCAVRSLSIEDDGGGALVLAAEFDVDFRSEAVGKNERFALRTPVTVRGLARSERAINNGIPSSL